MSIVPQALGSAGQILPHPAQEHLTSHLAEARSLGRRASPMIAAGMLSMGLTITDTAMMGWLDPRVLASGIVVTDAYSILFQLASGMVAAVAPLAAEAIGANDRRRAGTIVGQGLWLLAPLALICGLAVAWSIPAMEWLGVDLPLRDPAEEYAILMGATFALMLVFAWARSALSAMGRQRIPMYVLAAALPLNAVGNYALMYGAWGLPEMGLPGAGASSLLVAIMAAGSAIAYMLAPSMRHFSVLSALRRIEPAIVLRLVPIGLMTGIATVAETGIYLGSTIVVGILSSDSLAAHAVVFRMLAFGYVIVVGFGQAVTVQVAERHGAGDRNGLERARRVAQNLAVFGTVSVLLVFLGCRQMLGGLATSDPLYRALIDQVMLLMPIAGIALAGLVLCYVHASILRGFSDVRMPAILAVGGYWGIGGMTMTVAVAALDMGAAGVWTGLAAGTAAAALGTAIYLARRPDVGPVPMRAI